MSGTNDLYDPKQVAALDPETLDAARADGRARRFAGATTLEALTALKPAHLGDRSPVLTARREIGALPPQARSESGKRVNEVRQAHPDAYDERHAVLSAERDERVLAEEAVDVTLPGDRPARAPATR